MPIPQDERDALCEFIIRRFSGANRHRTRHLKQTLGVEGNPTHYGTIAELPDETLLEIAEFYERDLQANPRWPQRGLRIFVSHVAAQRARLARVRELLARWSINFFLAHDDIQVDADWSEELVRALGEMDAFVAVHSAGYAASVFCNQEAGFALAREVPRLAVLDGEAPCGFLNQRQGTPWREDQALADAIVNVFSNNEVTSARIAESFAKALKEAGSFASADFLTSRLQECENISPAAARDIYLAHRWNDQVSGSGNGRRLCSAHEVGSSCSRDLSGRGHAMKASGFQALVAQLGDLSEVQRAAPARGVEG